MTAASTARLWGAIAAPIGRDAGTGGYRRYAWTDADLTLREWFVEEARDRGLERRGRPQRQPVGLVGRPPTGDRARRHRQPPRLGPARRRVRRPARRRVRRSLAVDGCASAASRRRGRSPSSLRRGGGRPVRRGLPGLAAAHRRARRRRARWACATATASRWPRRWPQAGRDPTRSAATRAGCGRIGAFVELHVEQGRALVDLATRRSAWRAAIWPHGRWRFDFAGEANHAGTTRLADRRDPMLTFATTVLAADEAARPHGARRHRRPGRASSPTAPTRSRPGSRPGWTPGPPTRPPSTRAGRARSGRAAEDARRDGTSARRRRRVRVPRCVAFDDALRDRLAAAAASSARPVLPTGAGHDAGMLAAAGVPTAMLFVRNPTGVSHSPAEHADRRRLRGRRARRSPTCWRTGWHDRERDLVLVRARLAGRRHGRRRRARRRSTDGRITAVTPDVDRPRAGADAAARPDAARPGQRALARLPPGAARPHPARPRHLLDLARADVRASPTGSTPTRYHALARASYAEMALAGITCVGEFHYLHHAPGGTPLRRPERDGRRR